MAKKKAEAEDTTAPDPETPTQVPVRFPLHEVEYLRDVAWWCRLTIQEILAAGARIEIEKLEKQFNNGKRFGKRGGDVKTGRPTGK